MPGVETETASAAVKRTAAQALQDAESVEEVLAAAELLVLPGEETKHWQYQAGAYTRSLFSSM